MVNQNKKMYGILINNLGTPNSCSAKDVRTFLKTFLWDPRVVDAPRISWWLVLNLIILNTRPKCSAETYKKIWTEKGSPLLIYSENITQGIRKALSENQWAVSFQSRLGPKKWLTPYTDKTLEQWEEQGCQSVQVICPGFSVDCLETLEEIAMENKQAFRDAGGGEYHYISCLNDSDQHIVILTEIIQQSLQCDHS